MNDIVENLRWGRFVKNPEVGIVSIVREFYANVPQVANDMATIRELFYTL